MLRLITIVMIASSSAAMAQSTMPANPSQPSPATPTQATPATAPTEAQCKAGYQDGMAWTRDDFTKACAKFKSVN